MPQLTIEDFIRYPATHIVSLGYRCATAYNIRRYYNFSSAFPFDWWITPEYGLIMLLSRLDSDFIYDPQQLLRYNDDTTVAHRTLCLLLHHEFPRNAGKISEDFLDHLYLPRQRTAYLIEKFRALNSAHLRILFIRENPDSVIVDLAVAHALDNLFDQPEWALAAIASIPEDSPADYRCDPRKWDAELAQLGVTLEPGRHRPFIEPQIP